MQAQEEATFRKTAKEMSYHCRRSMIMIMMMMMSMSMSMVNPIWLCENLLHGTETSAI